MRKPRCNACHDKCITCDAHEDYIDSIEAELAAAQAELRETREQREQAIKERDEAQKRLAERCTTIMPTPPSSEHATTAMGLLCHKTGNKMLCDREPVPNPRTTGGRMWDCANCEGSRGATMALLPFTAYSASDAAKRMESIIVERDEAIRERALLSKACDDITAMLNEANVPSAGLGIDERIALMLDDNTALASQNAVMREALEHFLDCLDAANAEGFAKIRLDARYSDYPARALVDLVERHLLFDTVYKANAALSTPPTQAEQRVQAMRDVVEAGLALKALDDVWDSNQMGAAVWKERRPPLADALKQALAHYASLKDGGEK